MLLTFADILASGNKKAILDFLREKNLDKGELGFSFSHIHYLMKEDEDFWREAVTILRSRLIFDETTWAFATKYKDMKLLR